MTRLVQGIGWNNGKYPVFNEGIRDKTYDIWQKMLHRCYGSKVGKSCATYVGCEVSENFKSYHLFHQWSENQIGFREQGFQLDKDLLVKGNKLYSEATCLYLPKELNCLIIKSDKSRGTYPIGVCWDRNCNKFCVKLHTVGRGLIHIGLFTTVSSAFQAYKKAKEDYVKAQAEKWQALIDPRAYAALIAYEVLMTD